MTLYDQIEAIRQLTHRYCAGVDNAEMATLLDTFATDATLDHSAMGIEKMSGHDELRAGYKTIFERLRESTVVHMVTNHLIELVDDQHARGSCYFTGTVQGADGSVRSSTGRYDDTYLRTDQGWRIHSRTTVPLVRQV